MEVLCLEKKRFDLFFRKLAKDFDEVVAPVKDDVVRFQKIKDPKLIYLEKNSYFPIKEYFFRKKEVIFTFDSNKISIPKPKAPKRIFFGVRRCDLNAIRHQDMVFDTIKDPYYLQARKNSYLIGYHCNEAPSPYCFCGSLDLVDFFDLMFYDRKDHFLVEVTTKKGEEILNRYKNLFTKTDIAISSQEKVIKGAERLDKKDISEFYDHSGWKKGVDLCLSCGACTTLCPTCYCFDLSDTVRTDDPKKGERVRGWSSCLLPEFTKVSGGHVFRQKREERFKHRIYHQLDYFKKRMGVNLCVGCGRCIEGCPTRIDFVQIINEMK